MRPPSPNLRAFADPEGPFLTYETVRASLHPAPAEQTLVYSRVITIIDRDTAESRARVEHRFAEVF